MAMESGLARIGKTVVVRGELKGSEDLVIDGQVEGIIQLTEGRLTIGSGAHVTADITARDVLVLGSVRGNVVSTGRVELRAGSQVDGDLHAARLVIEDNAIFHGRVELSQAGTAQLATEAV